MKRALGALVLLLLGSAGWARADGGLPPWSDPGDLPVPTWARSIVPFKNDQVLQTMPDVSASRRGSVTLGSRLPLYGARRGPGCEGRWWLVGPYAWLCSDAAELSVDEPSPPLLPASEGFLSTLPPKVVGEGLPYRYFFVGKDGASGGLATASGSRCGSSAKRTPHRSRGKTCPPRVRSISRGSRRIARMSTRRRPRPKS